MKLIKLILATILVATPVITVLAKSSTADPSVCSKGQVSDYDWTAHTAKESFKCVPAISVSTWAGNTYMNYPNGGPIDISALCVEGVKTTVYVETHDNKTNIIANGCVAGLYKNGKLEVVKNINFSSAQNVYIAKNEKDLFSLVGQ